MTAPMDASPNGIRRLALSVATARDEELDPTFDHDQAAELMDALADDPARPMPPALAQHLARCPDCRSVFDALVEVAFLERRGALPDTDVLLTCLSTGTPGRPGEASVAVAPRAEEASPARPGPSWALRVREAFAVPTPWAVPALAAAALLLAVGWSSTQLRVDDLVRQLDLAQRQLELASPEGGGLELARMEAMLRSVDTMRFAQAEDGSWGRVVFDPDATRAMMWAGGLPDVPDGARISCWLLSEGRPPELVWEAERLEDGDQQWWLIEADSALATYDSVSITLEPAGTPVVQVPLQGS